jgi:hypothetical protein
MINAIGVPASATQLTIPKIQMTATMRPIMLMTNQNKFNGAAEAAKQTTN